MKRSFWMLPLALAFAACSARGSSGGGGGPIDPPDGDTTDAPVVDTPTVDSPVVDVPSVDSPVVDVPTVDTPSVDVPVADVPLPPDGTTGRCTRDSECTGSTWCDMTTGACMPIVCTPGRVTCPTAMRARTCDSRGASFSEMDCPGGCADGVCSGASTCTAPMAMCGGVCVNTQSDAANCGACGRACAAGQSCTTGVCSSAPPTCMSPMAMCGTLCVNPQTDAANCGGCGRACAAGQTCTAGVCGGGACVPPLTRCGTACADITSDPANCGACVRACAVGQACTAGVCGAIGTGPTLRITSLGTAGCSLVEHVSSTGDDRGGIALGTSTLFYSGDTSTARFDPDTLANTALGRVYDGLLSNIRTGTIYNLATATGPLVNTMAGGTITSLVEIDSTTGLPTTRTVPLSMSLTLGSDTGIFSGWDRVVFASSGRVYNVDLPSGRVTDLGAMVFPTHQSCENWAFWGVAEYFDGRVYLSYVEGSTRIARVRVPDAVVSTVGTFTNLSDMCSFTVSPTRSRWYFHHEGVSQFGGSDESFGRCPAVISAGGASTCSAPTTMCGIDCVDLQTSTANCGACGRACAASQSCRAGVCTTATTLPNYTRTTPPSTVLFEEVCAATGATRVLPSLDDSSVFGMLPFAFPFWGTTLPAGRMVNIATNGMISLDGMSATFAGTIPATTAPNGQIVAWGADLITGTAGVCYATLGAAPSRRFVVEWSNTRPYPSTATGLISTEIVLNESDGAIDILTSNYSFASTSTAIVGIENLDGTRGVSGCAATTAVCSNATNNRIRFVPSP
jgi:Stigma-specific protein, Stig1